MISHSIRPLGTETRSWLPQVLEMGSGTWWYGLNGLVYLLSWKGASLMWFVWRTSEPHRNILIPWLTRFLLHSLDCWSFYKPIFGTIEHSCYYDYQNLNEHIDLAWLTLPDRLLPWMSDQIGHEMTKSLQRKAAGPGSLKSYNYMRKKTVHTTLDRWATSYNNDIKYRGSSSLKHPKAFAFDELRPPR